MHGLLGNVHTTKEDAALEVTITLLFGAATCLGVLLLVGSGAYFFIPALPTQFRIGRYGQCPR